MILALLMACSMSATPWTHDTVPGLTAARYLVVDGGSVWVGGLDARDTPTVWRRDGPASWTAVWSAPNAQDLAGLAHDGRGLAVVSMSHRPEGPGSTYAFHRVDARGTVGPWPLPMRSVVRLRACGGRYWAHGARGLMTSDDGLSWDEVQVPGDRNSTRETLQCLDDGRVALLGPTSVVLTDGITYAPLPARFHVTALADTLQVGREQGHTVIGTVDTAPLYVQPRLPGRPHTAARHGDAVWLFRDRTGRKAANTLDFMVSTDGGRQWTVERTFSIAVLRELTWIGRNGEAWAVTRDGTPVVWHRRPNVE